ncbi:type II secretion system F family protein [Colwellia sp. Arc7-D]|uniref:type II secretion system F family protein n=1 Tax=Colwellia sp. Arc7-D TaxID=2161872 RepID=UPI000D350364|nr:type II secretion system F family protein [Colwellia sp. Arc7-D]AWB59170.1 hypothetical protein DBO93_17460 [Colwellia sp. Arc7-D]
MALFRYKILTTAGQAEENVTDIPVDTPIAAHEYLERNGSMVISVSLIPALLKPIYLVRNSYYKRQIKRGDIAEFLRNLAIMLKSGVPILEALTESSENGSNPYLSFVILDIKSAVESGVSLSVSIERHMDIFPKTVFYMAKVGEETGRLDTTLMDAAQHLIKIDRIFVDINKALMYPLFVLVFALGACFFWLHYTVPNMMELFVAMQVELPAITVAVLDASEIITTQGPTYLAGFIVVILCIVQMYKRSVLFQYKWAAFVLKTPVFANLIIQSNLSYIFEYFALLSKSGIDIRNSLGIISDAVSNPIYSEKMGKIKVGIEAGNRLSTQFKSVGGFPPVLIRMIATGENSGRLSEQMEFIASDYATKLQDAIDKFKLMIEPMSVVFVGALCCL